MSQNVALIILTFCLLLLVKVQATETTSSSVQSDLSRSPGESDDLNLEATELATPNQAGESDDDEINDLLRLIGFENSQTSTRTSSVDTRGQLEQATSSSTHVVTLRESNNGGSSTAKIPEELAVEAEDRATSRPVMSAQSYLLQLYDEAREMDTNTEAVQSEQVSTASVTSTSPSSSSVQSGSTLAHSESSADRAATRDAIHFMLRALEHNTSPTTTRSSIIDTREYLERVLARAETSSSPESEFTDKEEEEEEEEGAEKCSVCLERLNKFATAETECKHKFHKACLDDWRKKGIAQKGMSSCPMCRAELPKIDRESCILCGYMLDIHPNGRNDITNDCGHTFHKNCLREWLFFNGFKETMPCPKCLADVPELNLNIDRWIFQRNRKHLDRPK